jgi:signal peptidase II
MYGESRVTEEMRPSPTFWRFAAAMFATDWITKWCANAFLYPHEPVPVIGSVVRFTLSYDARTTFWLGIPGTPSWRVPGGLVAYWIVILAALSWILWFAARAPHAVRWWQRLFGVLFGAGMGNVVEHAVRGKVVNFLDVGASAHRWPTFNLADAALVSGVIALGIVLGREWVRERGRRGAYRALGLSLPRSVRGGGAKRE